QEREQARRIREQQDEAYQASLRADQEKERRAQEERERLQREKEEEERKAREREEAIEARKRRKQELIATLPPEPDASEPESTRLGIRMPSGERVVRRFRATDKIGLLYHFIETLDLSPLDDMAEIIVVNTFPRKEFTDMNVTIKEAGLFPSGSVIVEEKVGDDGDGDA
ncbi:hypothetical protein HK102_006193, partial [Quaeritorhiza haematococci]